MKKKNRLAEITHTFCAWLIILVVCIGGFNAIARYLDKMFLTSFSSNAYLELQWYMFSVIFLFGASVALVEEKHIRVDVFFQKLSKKEKARINVLGTTLLLMPFCCVMIYYTGLYFYKSLLIKEVSSDPNGLYPFIIKAFIPFSFFLLLIQSIWYLMKNLEILKNAPQN